MVAPRTPQSKTQIKIDKRRYRIAARAPRYALSRADFNWLLKHENVAQKEALRNFFIEGESLTDIIKSKGSEQGSITYAIGAFTKRISQFTGKKGLKPTDLIVADKPPLANIETLKLSRIPQRP